MLDNLEQEVFNTTPADSELDFQNHTVEQTRSQGFMSVACFCRRSFLCKSGSECVIPIGEDQALLYILSNPTGAV